MGERDESGFEAHLNAARNANDGWAITIWKDGGWKLWRTLDARYAERDPDHVATIPGDQIQAEIETMASTGHAMKSSAITAPANADAELMKRLRSRTRGLVSDFGPDIDCHTAAARIASLSAEVERLTRERDNLCDLIDGIGQQCSSAAAAIRSGGEP